MNLNPLSRTKAHLHHLPLRLTLANQPAVRHGAFSWRRRSFFSKQPPFSLPTRPLAIVSVEKYLFFLFILVLFQSNSYRSRRSFIFRRFDFVSRFLQRHQPLALRRPTLKHRRTRSRRRTFYVSDSLISSHTLWLWVAPTSRKSSASANTKIVMH